MSDLDDLEAISDQMSPRANGPSRATAKRQQAWRQVREEGRRRAQSLFRRAAQRVSPTPLLPPTLDQHVVNEGERPSARAGGK